VEGEDRPDDEPEDEHGEVELIGCGQVLMHGGGSPVLLEVG
jgi:hypothetical protein